jgi:O-antigen/teichoic acid export membrane protein
MSERRRYLANAASMAGQSVIQKMAGFVSTIVLAQTLHVQGLGLVAVTSGTATAFYGVARLGTDAGVHVLTAETNSSKDAEIISEILSHALILFLGIALVASFSCYMLADRIAGRLFDESALRYFIQLAAALLFFQVVTQFVYIAFAGLHAFTHYARISIFAAPVSAGLTIVGAYAVGATGAALGLVGGQALLAVVLLHRLWQVCRDQNIRFRPSLSAHWFRAILFIGLPFYASGLLIIPAEYIIQALLVRAHGVSVMGDLRVITAITSVIATLPSFLSGPMISEFARTRSRNEASYISFVFLNARIVLFGGVIAMTVLGILWPNIIQLGFGPSYSGARQIGYIALFTAVLLCMQTVLTSSLLASKNTRIYFVWSAATTSLFVAAAAVLVPHYGLGGYLGAQCISALGASIYMTIRYLYQEGSRGTEASAISMAFVLMTISFVLVVIADEGAWGFLLRLIAAAAAVVVQCWLWLRYVFKKEDISAIGLNSGLLTMLLGIKRAWLTARE